MKRNPDSNYRKYDDYCTPKHAWQDIEQYIPRNKILWEAFYCDGTSGKHLQELGFDVIHENIDFFTTSNGGVIVSNPPFSKTKQILTRLRLLDKPFILIMPISKLSCQYTRNIFKDSNDKLQIIIPAKRIHFIKIVDGVEVNDRSNKCNFDSVYFCWKINLPEDITWLNK